MEIKTDPDELRDCTDKVLADITDIERQGKALSDIVRASRNYWSGEASDAHFRIFSDAQQEAARLIREIREDIMKVRAAAGMHEDAGSEEGPKAAELPSEVF